MPIHPIPYLLSIIPIPHTHNHTHTHTLTHNIGFYQEEVFMVPVTTHGDRRGLDIRTSYLRRYIHSVTMLPVCVSIIVTCIMFLYVSVSLCIDKYVCH